mmetsp:Transcript_66616/g.185857  ORF Transcript_66616/g.185857 Transcript_66616/m.185857 type:complete len:261 (+) Transcript_66616:562-1344(+)
MALPTTCSALSSAVAKDRPLTSTMRLMFSVLPGTAMKHAKYSMQKTRVRTSRVKFGSFSQPGGMRAARNTSAGRSEQSRPQKYRTPCRMSPATWLSLMGPFPKYSSLQALVRSMPSRTLLWQPWAWTSHRVACTETDGRKAKSRSRASSCSSRRALCSSGRSSLLACMRRSCPAPFIDWKTWSSAGSCSNASLGMDHGEMLSLPMRMDSSSSSAKNPFRFSPVLEGTIARLEPEWPQPGLDDPAAAMRRARRPAAERAAP